MLFANVDPAFMGSRICDTNPAIQWNLTDAFEKADNNRRSVAGKNDDGIDAFLNFGVFHPTERGHHLYQQVLANTLGCDTFKDIKPAVQYRIGIDL